MIPSVVKVTVFLISLLLFNCREEAIRDVSGKYKKVWCEEDLDPEYSHITIFKREGNNFYIEVSSVDGTTLREKLLYGLYGNEFRFHGQPMVTFSDNFTKVDHSTLNCKFEK